MRSPISLILLSLLAFASAQTTSPSIPTRVAVPPACPECNSVLSAILACPATNPTPQTKEAWLAAAKTIVPCLCKALSTPASESCANCILSADSFGSSTTLFSSLKQNCAQSEAEATQAFLNAVGAVLVDPVTSTTADSSAPTQAGNAGNGATKVSGAESLLDGGSIMAVFAGALGVAAAAL
ncbi:hypothetical protein HK097_003800 [Rhizophlyctis rosea]|uniref:Uncharacterized protein n=1 Tax=Rhizophlyctis rosea TaxID=64517 RepID=A0AAD5S2D5_9FUNG|nr:hypothetical protein HK097_003800 [Rhizophlyctis rosea]